MLFLLFLPWQFPVLRRFSFSPSFSYGEGIELFAFCFATKQFLIIAVVIEYWYWESRTWCSGRSCRRVGSRGKRRRASARRDLAPQCSCSSTLATSPRYLQPVAAPLDISIQKIVTSYSPCVQREVEYNIIIFLYASIEQTTRIITCVTHAFGIEVDALVLRATKQLRGKLRPVHSVCLYQVENSTIDNKQL